MRSFWKLPVHVDSKSFPEVITVAKKIEDTVQVFHGLSIQVPSWSARAEFSVTDCDRHIEWMLSSTDSWLHNYVKDENWEVGYRIILDGKRERNRMRDHFARTFPRNHDQVRQKFCD